MVNQDVLLLVRNPENQDNTGSPSKPVSSGVCYSHCWRNQIVNLPLAAMCRRTWYCHWLMTYHKEAFYKAYTPDGIKPVGVLI